jgi:hypothetical protein
VVLDEIWLVVTGDIHLRTAVWGGVLVVSGPAPSHTVLGLAPLPAHSMEGRDRQTLLHLPVVVVKIIRVLYRVSIINSRVN